MKRALREDIPREASALCDATLDSWGLSIVVIGSKAVCNARILKLMASFEACEPQMPVQVLE